MHLERAEAVAVGVALLAALVIGAVVLSVAVWKAFQ